jgi:CDGSH-type Zn-finger protein
MSKEMKIKVSKNGPYVVRGPLPVTKQIIDTDSKGVPEKWKTDTEYPTRSDCALCRCGQSKNKPFCDGTHLKVNFDGTETASTEPYANRAKKIEGPALELADAEELCASARFCHRGGDIWDVVTRSDNPESRRTVIEDAGDCPSGRLVVTDKKTKKTIEPEFEKSVVVVEDPQMNVDGPIWVRGGVPIESCGGKIYEIRNRVTLCRCGKSANKPFCDSSHYPE